MFRGHRRPETSRDEGERPFWISFADLMTALMVLFLVVMIVSLVQFRSALSAVEVVQQENRELTGANDRLVAERRQTQQTIDRARELQAEFWRQLTASTRGIGVRVRPDVATIDLGDRGQFDVASSTLKAQDVLKLRRLAPLLVDAASSTAGRRVVEQVTVEGYASPEGTYLGNLDLSARRSQSVVCALLGAGGPSALSPGQRLGVRRLFSTGGFSSNNVRRSFEASRRVEIRVIFAPPGESPTRRSVASGPVGACPAGVG